MLDYIKQKRAEGHSDPSIGASFRADYGRSPIGVDHHMELPPPLSAVSPFMQAPLSPSQQQGVRQQQLMRAHQPVMGAPVPFGTDPTDGTLGNYVSGDPAFHSTQMGAAAGGLAGLGVGAVTTAADLLAVSGGMDPRAISPNTAAAAGALTHARENVARRREMPTYETTMESGGEVLMGLGMLAREAAATATGFPPPGHRGPYGASEAFDTRSETGANVASGLTLGLAGLGGSILPISDAGEFDPSQTYHGIRTQWPELALLAGPSVIKKAAPKIRETASRQWAAAKEAPGPSAFKGAAAESAEVPLGPKGVDIAPVLDDASVEALVEKRFAQRSRIKEPAPAPKATWKRKAVESTVSALVGSAALDFVLPPGLGAVVSAGAPMVFRALKSRVGPRSQAWLDSALRQVAQWHRQGTPGNTEIARLMTRAPAEVAGEIPGLVRELSERVKRGEAGVVETFDEAMMTERPAAREVALAPNETGTVQLDPEALAWSAELDLYATEASEAAAGHKAAAKAQRAEATAARKPYVEPARELKEMAAGERKIASGERKVASEIMERAKREKDAARPALAEHDVLKEANLAEAQGQRALAEAERNVAQAKKTGATEATERFARGERLGAAELQRDASDLATYARDIAERIKSAKAESMLSANPKIKGHLAELAKVQKASAVLARRDASLAREGAKAVSAISSISKKAVTEMTKAEITAGLADAAATRGVAGRFADAAKDHARIAAQLRKVVKDIYATDKKSARHHGDAAKRSAQVAKRLGDQARALYELADEAAAPYKSAGKLAKAKAKALDEGVVEVGASTQAERDATAGLIKKEEGGTKVSVKLRGADDIIDRVVESMNSASAPGAPRAKRANVVQILTDALHGDGLGLLLSPRARGHIYSALVGKMSRERIRLPSEGILPPYWTTKQSKAFIVSMDDAMVEMNKQFLTKEPVNIRVTMPDGTSKTMRELIKEATSQLEKTDPKTLAEWQAQAIKNAGTPLGAAVEKSLTAQEMVNEANRFTYSSKTKKGSEIRHLDAKTIQQMRDAGESAPMIGQVEIVRQIDPTVGLGNKKSNFVKMDDGLYKFMVEHSPDKAIPANLWISKGLQATLKSHIRATELLESADFAVKMSRMAKLAYTAKNAPTHKGNFSGNVVFEMGATGVDPATIVAGTIEFAEWWRRGTQGKLKGAELDEFRGLQRSNAMETSLVEDVGRMMEHHAKSEGAFAGLRKAGDVLQRLYRIEDTIFKGYSARRTYKVLVDRTSRLAEGKDFWMQLRDGKVVKFTKKDGNLTLNGKTLTASAKADLLANGATLPGLGRFFDYTAGGLAVKNTRQSSLGSAAAPYYSWPYHAVGIPGVKRGLLSNMLDDAGGGFWRTNDPVLIKEGGRMAIGIGLRKTSLERAGQALLPEGHNDIKGLLTYGLSEEVPALAFPTGTPGEADVLKFRQEYAAGPQEILWRFGHAGAVSMIGGEWLFRPEVRRKMKGWTETTKMFPGLNFDKSLTRLQRMWLKKESGAMISGKQAMGMVGIGGALMEGIYDELAGKRGYGPQPIRWHKVAFDFTKMMLGGTPGTAIEVGFGLADPHGDMGGRRTSMVEGKRGPEPAIRYMVRKLLGIGAHPINTQIQFDRQFKMKKKMLKASLSSAHKRRLEKLAVDETMSEAERNKKIAAVDKRYNDLSAIVSAELVRLYEGKRGIRKQIEKFGGKPTDKSVDINRLPQ